MVGEIIEHSSTLNKLRISGELHSFEKKLLIITYRMNLQKYFLNSGCSVGGSFETVLLSVADGYGVARSCSIRDLNRGISLLNSRSKR